jgi:hypothetical protein
VLLAHNICSSEIQNKEDVIANSLVLSVLKRYSMALNLPDWPWINRTRHRNPMAIAGALFWVPIFGKSL